MAASFSAVRSPGHSHRCGLQILALFPVVCVIVTGCDTGTKRATVENQCGETLMIAVVEAPVPNAHGYAGAGAEAYGESVAPGSSNEYALMASAGGFVIEAEASDGSV